MKLWIILFLLSFNAYAMRVVSTSPAITEMILMLGEEKSLVGKSDYCKGPDVPKVGSALDLSFEKVFLLKPELLIIQQNASNKVLGNLKRMKLNTLEIPLERLSDIDTSFLKIAEAFKKTELAQMILADKRAKLYQLKKSKLKALIVIGDDGRGGQWSVAGKSTLYGDVLDHLGLENALIGEQNKFSMIGAEALLKINPDLLIFLSQETEKSKIFSKLKSRIIYIDREDSQIPSPAFYDFMISLQGKLR